MWIQVDPYPQVPHRILKFLKLKLDSKIDYGIQMLLMSDILHYILCKAADIHQIT
jgi:hypothetical protein